MNNLQKSLVTAMIAVISVAPLSVKAAEVKGGTITYKWVSDSTYTFYCKLYFECAGISYPSSVDICLFNTCTNQIYTQTLPVYTGTLSNGAVNGSEIMVTCGENKTRCSIPTSTLPGVREYWYMKTITLPDRCTNWKFSFGGILRDNNENLSASTVHIESSLDNKSLLQNSSPDFIVKPYYITTKNSTINLNNGVFDPDKDSVAVSIVHPMSSSNCSQPTNASFITYSPALAIPGNPLPSANSFTLNPVTGDFSFTATKEGTYVLDLKFTEYRNGVAIGSVLREVCIVVLPAKTFPSPSFTPILNSITGASWNNGELTACVGQPLQMCFDIKSADPKAKLQVTDDMQVRFPGASISYYQSDDSVRGCLAWTPGIANTGRGNVYLVVRNIACDPLPLTEDHNRTFKVYVVPQVKASADTIICKGETAQLNVSGGNGAYSWSILPGGSSNSLSCINCANPVAIPSSKTAYRVVTNNHICSSLPNYRDTVQVDLHTAATTVPALTISVTPGSTIHKDSPATFIAVVTGCVKPQLKWMKNGIEIPNAISSTWTVKGIKDNDVISCRLICGDTCPKPRVQVSSGITMKVLSGISRLGASNEATIYPNPNTGQFTISSKQNLIKAVEIYDVYGKTIYSKNDINKEEINIQEIPTGVYTLRLYTKGKILMGRFVVAR